MAEIESLDTVQDAARKAFLDDPSEITARAWLRAELNYGFFSKDGVEEMSYADVVRRADELMTKRKGR